VSLTAAAGTTLMLTVMAGTAHATIASIPGGWANVVPTWADFCSTSNLYVTFVVRARRRPRP